MILLFSSIRANMRQNIAALLSLGAFMAAAAFNGTSDPLMAVFMPLLCLAAGLLLWPGIGKGWRVPVSGVVVCLALFIFYLSANVLWSSVPFMSLLFALLFLTFPLVFFGIVLAQNPLKTAYATAVAFGAGWAGLALWAIAQFFILRNTEGHRISGPMLDPNNMAALFNMGLLPVAALFLVSQGKPKFILSAVLYAIMLTGLAVTQSRAGFAIALSGLVLLGLLEWRCLRISWRKLALYIVLPLAIYVVVNIKTDAKLTRSFQEVVSTTSPSVVDRMTLWQSGLRMFADHPFGTIGLGNFYYYYPAYRGQKDLSDGFFVHADPLQLALETGFPAFFLFYGFLTAVLLRTVGAAMALPSTSPARGALLGSFIGLLSLALHAHVNYDLYLPGILIPAGVLLAVWYLASEQAAEFNKRKVIKIESGLKPAILGMVLIAGLSVLALWPVRNGLSSWALQRAGDAGREDNLDAAQKLILMAAQFGPACNFSAYEMLARLEMELAKRSSGGSQKNHLSRGMAYIRKARACNPVFAVFMNLEAQFYYMGRDSLYPDGAAKATALLEQAVKSNPLDIDAREGLSLMYKAQGRSQEALAVLEEGLKWPRPKGGPDLHYLLTVAKARQETGNQQGHDAIMDFARQKSREYNMPIGQ